MQQRRTSHGPSAARVAFSPSPQPPPVHKSSVPPERTQPVEEKWLDSWERDLLVLSTIVKVLLFPAYRSTDFEVHRNWLAITHSLPLSKWYYDKTSEWTLDYPPFFAYFEWILSIPASFIDPRIVDLKNLNYDAWTVVAYQRTTVILTELVMGVALLKFIRGSVDPSMQRIISASLFLHPGFLIVDHIHFQYNGFLFGILLWSLLMARNGNKLASGILFAVLLNFKHIYMYLAPAYFVYLLRSFCISPQGVPQISNFLSLANSVLLVFAVSLGPFILIGQLPQLLSRLFPFTRGLNHAYWAPNAWALVTALDRVLLKGIKISGIYVPLNTAGVASSSRGLVGDTVFAVLPNIKPFHTFVATITSQLIFLPKLWMAPTYKSFLTALTLCGYCSFMFGWHVHEKAIMLVLVPLSLIAADDHAHFRTFVIASAAGIYSLFPLIFTPSETFVKIVYSLVWFVMVYQALNKRLYEYPSSFPLVIIDRLERLYLGGFLVLQIFTSTYTPTVGAPLPNTTIPSPEEGKCAIRPLTELTYIFCEAYRMARAANSTPSPVLEFLPLMLTSVYCAIGLGWAFVRLSVIYLRS